MRESLVYMIKSTGITHFPTHKELNEFYGSSSLSVALTRMGGTRRWSKMLNLPAKACANTEFGNKYELQAISDIKQEVGVKCVLTTERYPYDLYTENNTKIDVKASMPLKGRNFDVWSFNLEKRVPTCDIYLFYCIGWDSKIVKRVIIPSCAIAGIGQIGIGSLSKYDNYIERWDLVEDYDNFMNEMSHRIDLIPKRRTMA